MPFCLIRTQTLGRCIFKYDAAFLWTVNRFRPRQRCACVEKNTNPRCLLPKKKNKLKRLVIELDVAEFRADKSRSSPPPPTPSIASPLFNRSSLEPNCRLEVRSGATARLRRDGADGRPWDGCAQAGTPLIALLPSFVTRTDERDESRRASSEKR